MEERYYAWLLIRVGYPGGYNNLMKLLFDTPFTYSIPMDANRYEDGMELRYSFAKDTDTDYRVVLVELDDKPCSMLEMLIALAIRMEDLMAEPDGEDRSWEWFYAMLSNCYLHAQYDEVFDKIESQAIISAILNRDYEYDGTGGLFKIQNPIKDMRDTEIWYQAMWWVNDYV